MAAELLFHSLAPPGWRLFRNPDAVLQAVDPAGVRTCLQEVQRAVRSEGYVAAGYVAYEAAAAYGFATHPPAPDGLPLVWFGLFRPDRVTSVNAPAAAGGYTVGPWRPSLAANDYAAAVDAIRRHIEAGDTYQINFTFRLRAAFAGDPLALFVDMCHAQRGAFAARLDLGRHVICSASPERFFTARDGVIVCDPMKGTAARGRWSADDRAAGLELRRSAKNRAENVMIVDVVRNDLGRIAVIGSVRVPSLYGVGRFPNVWQMTSRVTARSAATLPDIFEALFPAASIVGAPKIRSAAIIRALEDSPRGVYTGAIGCVEPDGRATFSVAIRTVTIDRVIGHAEYGVGSGIVWDSSAGDEYDECCLKAQVVDRRPPAVELIETLAWSPGGGFELLGRHLERLRLSAAYFGIPCDRGGVLRVLDASVQDLDRRARVRLLLAPGGACRASAEAIPTDESVRPVRAALARTPVDPAEPWLYHKTTRRETYARARAERPDAEEVILWNPSGEVTEGTVTNVVVEVQDRRVTPPVSAGLLAGTFRDDLLASGAIVERRVTVAELREARRIWVVNSVRGWREAMLIA
jgi:para-aminobenzoate synthetase / 4-amino-4-deoxychorismate lyase